MKQSKIILCLMMAVFVLAGCTTQTVSSILPETSSIPASVSSSIAEQSLPTPPFEKAEHWREIYYQLIMENLWLSDDTFAAAFALYYRPSAAPAMAIYYDDVDGRHNVWYKMWRIDDGVPVLIYDGKANYLYFNFTTGNAVCFQQVYGVTTAIEYNETEELLLYKTVPAGNSYVKYYVYGEDKWYEWPESLTIKPMDKFDIETSDYSVNFSLYRNSSERQPGVDPEYVHSVLIHQLLDLYEPAVPEDAPAWVSEYMQLLYNQIFYQFDTEGFSDIDLLGFDEIVLLESIDKSNIPVLYYPCIPSSESLSYLYPVDIGNEYFIRPFFSGGGYGYSAHLYKDNKGNILWLGGDGEGSSKYDWKILRDGKLKFLFSANFGYESPGYAWCDGQVAWFEDIESWDTRRVWVSAQTDIALAKYGCGPQSSITDLSSTTYPIPVQQATWPELEAILIDIFCQHARSIGQWGA